MIWNSIASLTEKIVLNRLREFINNVALLLILKFWFGIGIFELSRKKAYPQTYKVLANFGVKIQIFETFLAQKFKYDIFKL